MANIMWGEADISGGGAILCSMADILSSMPDILNVQHQSFWNWNVSGFSKGKIHFSQKVLKNWSSCQKTDYHFLGGVRAKSDNLKKFFESFH